MSMDIQIVFEVSISVEYLNIYMVKSHKLMRLLTVITHGDSQCSKFLAFLKSEPKSRLYSKQSDSVCNAILESPHFS